MKLLIFSDLHLEFGSMPKPPVDSDGDVLILAGDIIIFKDFEPLGEFLAGWTKPVLYIAGNHEYYTKKSMVKCEENFIGFLTIYHPNVIMLRDEGVTIDGVHFFGGTMWTDFNNSDPISMMTAHRNMNDYHLIHNGTAKLNPSLTTIFHREYIRKLTNWFEEDLSGHRVVISHHAPVDNPNSTHYISELKPAYVSTDIEPLIVKYKPALWIYGHTHETDYRLVDETRIISNPRGYPLRGGGQECKEFDENGAGFLIG